MLEHIRRPETLNTQLADAFKAVVALARTNPQIALRIVFRKADGTVRTMDVAYDEHMSEAFADNVSATREAGNEERRATNTSRRNLVVRERLRDDNGNYVFQWRTIPLTRIMSVSPML